ncbi:beta-lactamase-like protein [Mycena floridula]|nr:beta-lactamase-like protein [Mycena floridula]
MASLKRVDKLTISFLVDNSIEWFIKLPPGFTHELPQQLRLRPEPSETTGVPTIQFDSFCCGAHGFSALITTEIIGETPHTTLFDTGPDSLSLVRNIKALKVPTEKIERVVISHWHSDHTGGLLSFLEHRKKATTIPCIVDVHPDRPIARGIAPGPNYDKVVGALASDPSLAAISSNGVFELHTEGHTVAGLWVSGEIPRVTSFEKGILGGMRWIEDSSGQGQWTPEQHIMDERYVAVDVVGKGLVVFSACSHAGIVNVVKHAIKMFSRPVYMIIGGLHLAPPDLASAIAPTVDFLCQELKPSPVYILPMHCSGFKCKLALEKAFGEGCVPAGVGMKVEVVGKKEDDDRLFVGKI